MAYPKGGPKVGGRKKGTPNKTTQAAKDVIAQAAEALGGNKRLVEWAKEDAQNEKVFWGTIYPKLIPVQLTGDPENPITHLHEIGLVPGARRA